ncbi:LysR family transcriptional regulator [Chenggangzhangella methanolivorans]|uniref:LysR family transcriptional regulator n=1 Tax=Chenggangzhangella methanolivorans TaxID=1437009 RepID=A0A9E6R704_9HYPH|nr:LysR family transcriptional regulator [Chenggangzhangella methanolivorans]QZN99128.1 LysR family transcriptional regulator [Chenggangzhangella methanolivorans]
MLLRHMEYVVALAQERHFGRAAALCGVTQPGLSSALKTLEAEIGTPIVQRHQRFDGFTPEGERLVEWCRRILADKRAMLDEMATMRSGLSGRLRIGVAPSAAATVARIVKNFRVIHPTVQFEVIHVRHERLPSDLQDFQLDAGITFLDEENRRFGHHVLSRQKMAALIPNNFQLATRDCATWSEVAQLPLSLLSRQTYERRAIDAQFQEAGFNPEPVIQSETIAEIFQSVAIGDTATILPLSCIEDACVATASRTIVLTSETATHELAMVWLNISNPAPLINAIVSVVKSSSSTDQIADLTF